MILLLFIGEQEIVIKSLGLEFSGLDFISNTFTSGVDKIFAIENIFRMGLKNDGNSGRKIFNFCTSK